MNVNLMIRILESFKGHVYMCMYISHLLRSFANEQCTQASREIQRDDGHVED